MEDTSQMNEYQRRARKFAMYRGKNTPDGVIYATLGLVGESGEAAEVMKKYLRALDRDSKAPMDEVTRRKLEFELGDVLWYVANLAAELGFTLEEIAMENLAKLTDRQSRNVLHGEGSDR